MPNVDKLALLIIEQVKSCSDADLLDLILQLLLKSR